MLLFAERRGLDDLRRAAPAEDRERHAARGARELELALADLQQVAAPLHLAARSGESHFFAGNVQSSSEISLDPAEFNPLVL